MKQISIFQGKPLKLETVWTDGHICNVMWTGSMYRLEGKTREFETLAKLTEHYKGSIRSMKVIK